MKRLLQTVALCGLVTLSAPLFAQSGSCSKAKAKAECGEAKAELATAKEDCGSKAKAELATAKEGCGSKAKAELATAKEGCSSKAKAELATAKEGCGSKAKAELATAKEGCSTKAKAECGKGKAELASAEGECSSKAKAECSKGGAELASAGDGACSSKAKAELAAAGECDKSGAKVAAIPASAQLASLMQPGRVQGVVVGGKAYLGEKAVRVVEEMVRCQVGTQIAANCEQSAKCEKTLAKNVEKTLAGGACMQKELSGLLAAGKIDSLIIDGESSLGEAALASLTKITSCEEFQAECKKRAGIEVAATEQAIPVRAQLAALITGDRVSGVVVDGKAYCGAEANQVLAGLIEGSVAATIKENCEQSASCEKTLAKNVEKALAGGTCAGSQLASLIECGKVQKVVVREQELCGAEAKAALAKIMSCETFMAECRSLASAPVEASSSCESKAQAKAACSTGSTLQ